MKPNDFIFLYQICVSLNQDESLRQVRLKFNAVSLLDREQVLSHFDNDNLSFVVCVKSKFCIILEDKTKLMYITEPILAEIRK